MKPTAVTAKRRRLRSREEGDDSADDTKREKEETVTVSVIIPCHNAESTIEQCLDSCLDQLPTGRVEVIVYDDRSTDSSLERIRAWEARHGKRVPVVLASQDRVPDARVCEELVPHVPTYEPRTGPGFARNCAVAAARGECLAFLDADDYMMPGRLSEQLALLREKTHEQQHCHYLIGCRIAREPVDAQPRYTAWINDMSDEHRLLHRFRSLTVPQTTFFMARAAFQPYTRHVAEDLIFWYEHLEAGGRVAVVEGAAPLSVYRHVPDSVSARTNRHVLRFIRARALERTVLSTPEWSSFMIWGAGRDGKAFFKMLQPATQERVAAFCDIDPRKIGNTLYGKHPVVHWRDAKPPLVLCVSLDRTGGQFEANVASLGLTEGSDYVQFT